MNTAFDKEIKFKLLKLLQEDPSLTQREMNQRMGVSLGKINFCISGLAEKGMIRIERFKRHSNKTGYLYRITPKGIKELSYLTLDYLKFKLEEYNRIKKEIQHLSNQVKRLEIDEPDDAKLFFEIQQHLESKAYK